MLQVDVPELVDGGQSGPRDPGNTDADQLARYQDAFRRYDIATLVRIIRAEAGQPKIFEASTS